MTMPAACVEALEYKPSSVCEISSSRATLGSAAAASCSRASPVDRLLQGHGLGRVLRHQLGQLVDLAERHLQHAADVAHHAARQKRAEGDDLRDLVGAVPVAHVADHLVAPVLAEVDVEVRHRDALGIEEALEQQPEAQRIEVGDGERVGDERAGAGAASRPDRNAVVLRPFDEVGDDQESSRGTSCCVMTSSSKASRVDGRPRARCPVPCRGGEAQLEPGLRLAHQLGRLVRRRARGEGRQDRLARARAIGAAPGEISIVEAVASGRSAKRASISARVLKRCSGDSCRRPGWPTTAPSLMQISASCAS